MTLVLLPAGTDACATAFPYNVTEYGAMHLRVRRVITPLIALVVMSPGAVSTAGGGPTEPINDVKGYYWSSAMPNTGFCAGSHAVNGGAAVGAQTALVAHGYYLGKFPVDGLFGPASTLATIQFQRALGLTVDGCIGPETWSNLQAGMIKKSTAYPSHSHYFEARTCCHVDYGWGRWADAQFQTCGVWTLQLDDEYQLRPYRSGPPASVYANKHVRMAQPGPLYWTLHEHVGGC